MNRRKFVQTISLASLGAPFMMRGMGMEAITKKLFDVPKIVGDRVLIMIRMNGGNDGLNTLIPLDGYDNLAIQRQNILIPQGSLLNIAATNALHPALTGFRDLFNDGKLGVVQNVGYPDQNRSHFRSMDIWTSGSLSQNETRGWLGRMLDAEYPNFPTDYPNEENPDPFAISMGYEVSTTCQGLRANFSHSVNNPFEVVNLPNTTTVNDGTYYGSQMEYLQMIISQTNLYGTQIRDAANAGNNLSTLYDLNNPLAKQLKNVARMISGGLQTKIYILNVDGFDTHDSQVQQGSPTLGTHANLLKRISDAVYAFQDDLRLLNLEHRVIGMTFSEFGRQVASNASIGTDHGDAAPLFLFGSCVSSGIYGSNPTIGNTVVNQEGLPMQVDFRDVYASILRDWFLIKETEVQTFFEHEVSYHNIVGACNVGVNETTLSTKELVLYPNPCIDSTTLKVEANNELIKVVLYDLSGREVAVLLDQFLDAGTHQIPIKMHCYAKGSYRVQVIRKTGMESLQLIKL